MADKDVVQALEESFRKFAMHGDTKATGNEMSGKNFAKLCKDCKVIDGKNITTTDVDISFSKSKDRSSRLISFHQFQNALHDLSRKRFHELEEEQALEEIQKLVAGKSPIISGVTKTVSDGAVRRLTDSTKYTGQHRGRFDEKGKGKGKAGREDVPNNSGYVTAYKGKGTFDKKVKEDN
uniref:tubulin polymerization-promoting protein family member 3-like n=1 Tax=Myxine glutinosa TaxID=7769 RepID=UPI00358F6001